MRHPAARGRTDANHRQVIEWYEELFCSVCDLHIVGGGCADLLVGIAQSVNDLVEVKTDTGDYEESQVEFSQTWRGRKPVTVRTHADVIAHVQAVREEVSRKNTWGRK